MAHYCDKFRQTYGVSYHVDGKKDGRLVSDIVGILGDDVDRIKATIDAYFADADPFITRGRHPLGLLRSQINRFTPSPTSAARSSSSPTWKPAPITENIRTIISAALGPGDPGYPEAHEEVAA